mmetsp:Transcript_101462/g.226613  ORF Transcript_101462/g.226613 Transcript_101462/m.226613 type:complete len:835 (+) Transcript_101462:106-2610(+)
MPASVKTPPLRAVRANPIPIPGRSSGGSRSGEQPGQSPLELGTTPPLHKAVADGDAIAVLRLLVRGANPNAEDAVFGEPPIYDAAVAGAASVVVLLLLFGADVRRHGRHTSATAAEFAPEGSQVAELLEAVACGDSQRSMMLGAAAVKPVTEEVPNGSVEALTLDWLLKAVGHPGFLPRSSDGATAIAEPVSLPHAPPMDVSEAADQILRRETSRARLTALHSRLASQRGLWVPPSLDAAMMFSPTSTTARIAWATVAACAPREALSVLAAGSGSLAELILDTSDDNAWRHATSQVAYDAITHYSRRKAPDGSSILWRDTFQEAATQRLYSWGVDGTVTGFGARSPQKAYSSPHELPLAMKLGGARPLVRNIACGRRHSAVSTFGDFVYVWGRDVVPPIPAEEAGAGLGAAPPGAAGLVRRGRPRTAPCDRPRRLAHQGDDNAETPRGSRERSSSTLSQGSGGPGTPRPTTSHSNCNSPTSRSAVGDAPPDFPLVSASLTANLSVTLLQLAGGWTDPEAEPPEGGQQVDELPPGLPALRKILRRSSFSAALTCDGRVFVWRRAGLLAAGAISALSEEPKSMLPSTEAAVDIAVGEGHVVVLSDQGRVWTFGWPPLSALGRGPCPSPDTAAVAAPVAGLDRIVQIGAGASFTLCVDTLGQLWLFGEGPCIIGCFNHPHALHEPRLVPPQSFGGRRVLAAACGDGHVLVLTAWDPGCRLPQPGAWFAGREGSIAGRKRSQEDSVAAPVPARDGVDAEKAETRAASSSNGGALEAPAVDAPSVGPKEEAAAVVDKEAMRAARLARFGDAPAASSRDDASASVAGLAEEAAPASSQGE